MEKDKKNDYAKIVAKVGIVTIIWNLILSLAKIIPGFIARTQSLISDGVHSASDVFTTLIVMIGAKISSKNEDSDHPFGHERMESIASILLAFLLFITACSIGYSGVLKIIDFANGKEIVKKSNMLYVALACAIASIIIKAWMYFYTIKVAKKINSNGLKADAFHHLTDSLSSIGSTLGIIGLFIGGKWSIMDPIACIIIALFIIKVSFDICRDAINQVVDKAAPIEFQEELKEKILENTNVLAIDGLKTRQFGNRYYVEVEIAVCDNLTVIQGHEIAEEIHDTIEGNFPVVKHCMVHVNPFCDQKEDDD